MRPEHEIGEAASKVSKKFKNTHPEIPWIRIIGQRHVLIHEYGEVEDELVWQVSRKHVPDLIEKLKPLVPPPTAV